MKRIIVALTAVSVAACAGYHPIVDQRGVDSTRYASDLAECQQYAQQRDPAGQAVAGALAGAVLGALIAAAAGARFSTGASARVGAVSGAAGAGAHGVQSQVDIVRNCLRGRGYSVLN